jgi:plastocyanin
MRAFSLAFTLGLIGATFVAAAAAERPIMQKGRVFSETDVTVKKGDALLFVNDDSVTHNIMSTNAGNEFNLGSMAPGVSTPVTFNDEGQIMVICAIHPRMKMTVKVTK